MGTTDLAENNGGIDSEHAIELDQCVIFGLIIIAIKEKLSDTFNRELFVSERQSIGTWRKYVGKGENVLGKGSRKENNLNMIWEHSGRRQTYIQR